LAIRSILNKELTFEEVEKKFGCTEVNVEEERR